MKGRGAGDAISAACVLSAVGSRNKLMDKHRTSLPAITRDETGTHVAIDVSEATGSEPARGSLEVTPGPDLVQGVGGPVDTGQGLGHRRA